MVLNWADVLSFDATFLTIAAKNASIGKHMYHTFWALFLSSRHLIRQDKVLEHYRQDSSVLIWDINIFTFNVVDC